MHATRMAMLAMITQYLERGKAPQFTNSGAVERCRELFEETGKPHAPLGAFAWMPGSHKKSKYWRRKNRGSGVKKQKAQLRSEPTRLQRHFKYADRILQR